MNSPGGSAQPDAGSDRLERLEARLASLEARLEALEGPRADRPPATAAEPPAAARPAAVRPAAVSPLSHLALAGRLCLVFAGAFLIRSLTDAATVPRAAGVALGLAYAAAWALAAGRAAGRGRASEAGALCISAALIAYPLIWEATVGFKLLAPAGAAAMLVVVASGLMAAAWRAGLQGAAWVVTLGALGAGFALMVATAAVGVFSLAFLLLGGGLLWLTYGRRWQDLRWPAALAADLAVLVAALLASWPGGTPELYRSLTPGRALALCLALVGVYLGSFVVRILMRQRELVPFEGVQGALALLVGFGGALRVAQASGSGDAVLAVAALLGGFACYGAAFAFVEKQAGHSGNFTFFTSLALVLVATGCFVLIGGAGRTWAFAGLGLTTTLLGLRFGRWTLLAHGSAYLSTAALVSELAARSLEAFLAADGARTPATAPALVALAALALVHSLLSRGGETRRWPERLPSLAAGAWAALGAGALLVDALGRLLPGQPPEPAALAAVRTAVLAGSAATLAALARRWPGSELRWLVYPLLGLAGLKLVISDLALGRPLTLFPSLAAFGAALILAPRLLRAQAEKVDAKE